MQQAQIVPKYVNQPREAHYTNGSVKDQQGTLWSVDKNALGMFQQGQPVMVGYEPASGNKRYPQIVAVNGQPIGQQPVAGTFQQVGQAAPMPQPQQYQQPAQPAPAPIQQMPEMRGASKDCGIFVTGLLGRCLGGTGTFPDLKTLRDMVYNARMAWEIEMEDKPEPQAVQPGPIQPAPAQFVPNAAEAPYDERNPPPHGQNILAAGE